MGRHTRPLGRRAALRAAAALGVAGYAGLGHGAARAALLTPADPKIRLFVEVSWQSQHEYTGTAAQQLAEEYIARHWTRTHPGVEVQTVAGPASGGNVFASGRALSATLNGSGPDILTGCCTDLAGYLDEGLLLPLNSLLKRDNIRLSNYVQAQFVTVENGKGTIYGMPDINTVYIFVVNLGLLDTLGIRYPEPNWTYTQAEELWRSIAGVRGSKSYFGAGFDLQPAILGADWLLNAFGGASMDVTHTRCTLDSPQALRALRWVTRLYREKVVTDSLFPTATNVGFQQTGSEAMYFCATQLRGLKWDFFPMPTWTHGRSVSGGSNNYGINAFTKHPLDLVWDLLTLLTVDKGWQRFFNIGLALAAPNQNDAALWHDWVRVVQAEAPPLRGKRMDYFYDALPASVASPWFQYLPAQAMNLEDQGLEQIFNGTVSVDGGAARLVRRINALESVGPQVTADLTKEQARVAPLFARARASATPIRYPAPSSAGVGVSPFAASSLVQAGRGGAYTLRGAGAGVNSSGDACTFAGAAATSSRGTFTCRVTAIRTGRGATMGDGAKIGLMARETLSALAASVGVEVATGRGVHAHARPVDAGNFFDQKPGTTGPGAAGLVAANGLLAADGQPASNYLLRPVWLRLALDVNRWSAYTSVDGRVWQQAGQPVDVAFAGAWVGLFVTSHQSGQYISATFDHVAGFVPGVFVRIGPA